jgi:hypothetical protein
MVAYPEVDTPENPPGADVIYRYVRTPAGAARYGVPIGTRIAVQKRPTRNPYGYSHGPYTFHRTDGYDYSTPAPYVPSAFIVREAAEPEPESGGDDRTIQELFTVLLAEIQSLKAQVNSLEAQLDLVTPR